MSEQWYYALGGQKYGPVPAEKLKELVASGQLRGSDLVWCKGISQWIPAQNVKGLFAPPKPLIQPPIAKDARAQPSGSAAAKLPATPVPPAVPRQNVASSTSPQEQRLETGPGKRLNKLPPWMKKKWIWIGAACVLLLMILSSKHPHNEHSTSGTTQSVSSVSWQEIDSIYNLSSGVTDLRKDEEWKKYHGKIVQWSGSVEDIEKGMFGGLHLKIKMNPHTFTFDLMIALKDGQESKAINLRKGDTITFKARLDSWGSLLPITLEDGEIIAP